MNFVDKIRNDYSNKKKVFSHMGFYGMIGLMTLVISVYVPNKWENILLFISGVSLGIFICILTLYRYYNNKI